MTGKYLLDTNIVIALRAADKTVEEAYRTAEAVYLPVIVLGELHYGAIHSTRVAENLAILQQLASTLGVLDCDEATATFYGRIKASLRAKGRPLPDNDIWIAALAQQYSLTVATHDAHFSSIDGLTTVAWQ